MTELEPSNRYSVRYQMENGCVVAFTDHALKRAVERNVDIEHRLGRLRGVPLKRYKYFGVGAWFKQRTGLRLLIVKTVW